MIHLLTTKDHMCKLYYAHKPYDAYSFMSLFNTKDHMCELYYAYKPYDAFIYVCIIVSTMCKSNNASNMVVLIISCS